jgi:two-component system chemotaxis sensor kinase CheA
MSESDHGTRLLELKDRLEALARMTVLIDAGDLPGLEALQQLAVVLAAEFDQHRLGELALDARTVAALAGAIVAGKALDAGTSFQEIGSLIERLQKSLGRASPGTAEADRGADRAAQSDADHELIVTWIADCEVALAELEGRLLSLERAPADGEVIADIRRRLHTLKGECGVLSLNAAQKLCHEAESLIDARTEANQSVPIDPLLELLDWLKTHVRTLATHPALPPAEHGTLLEKLAVARVAAQTAGIVSLAPRVAAARPDLVAAEPGAASPDSVQVCSGTPSDPDAATVASSAAPRITFTVAEGTDSVLSEFLCEARDQLAGAEVALLELEQRRTDSELLNTVLRAFNTLKSLAAYMTIQPMTTLAHSVEQLLDAARSGNIELERSDLDLILAACDMTLRLLGVLEGTPGPLQHDYDALMNRLHAAESPEGRAAQPAPSTGSLSDTEFADEAYRSAPAPSTTEVAVAADSESAGAPKARRVDQTVKVNTTRMDSLVTMVGELVIAQQMVVQDVAAVSGTGPRIQRTLNHMSKMVRELQAVSMSLRLVNLKGTFQKMTRLVRDVAQKSGKQIEVLSEGEDVELDRNMVEAITDPLVHMIRNACDHGIEGLEERRASGKSPLARVTLRAYHAGGSIVIEIGDDGRGLRRDKLLAKAKSKGLLPADLDTASLSDNEVHALIFLPGFSTAEKVTDLSGRGVGMDVVQRNIEALRGKVEIRSTPGQGTTFLLRLPLTMAIIDGMVVRVGEQRYVLPTLSIQQSFRPHERDIKTVIESGEMVRVRGAMLPIHRLKRVLDLDEGLDRITDALLVVIEADDERFCLLVDEILGQHQVVIKTLDHIGERVKGVSGGAILGDGRVALILDMSQIVALARESSTAQLRASGCVECSGATA